MGYTTAKGLPIPFGFEGNNVPQDLLALAARFDGLFSSYTDTQVGLLNGADLWDGRVIYQSDTLSTTRPLPGLYIYKAAIAKWIPLTQAGTQTNWIPTLSFATPGSLALGSGSWQVGRMAQFGTRAFGLFTIRFGSSGVSMSGVGNDMQVALPTQAGFTPNVPASTITPVGFGIINDSSAAKTWVCDIVIDTQTPITTVVKFMTEDLTVIGNYVDAATPFGWAASDGIMGLISFETVAQ